VTVIVKKKERLSDQMFRIFRSRVRSELWKYGLDMDEISDYDYLTAFERGVSPKAVAAAARKNAGADF
jgi:hypothetical protein